MTLRRKTRRVETFRRESVLIPFAAFFFSAPNVVVARRRECSRRSARVPMHPSRVMTQGVGTPRRLSRPVDDPRRIGARGRSPCAHRWDEAAAEAVSDERRDYVYVAFRRARSSRAIAREARGESIAIASDRRRRPAVGGRTRLRARATMRARRARDARMRLKCFDRSARDDGRIARGTRLTTRALDVFARAGFSPGGRGRGGGGRGTRRSIDRDGTRPRARDDGNVLDASRARETLARGRARVGDVNASADSLEVKN